MKKLYAKPISLFKYVITISTAFILIASIITLFFGFNKSVYFGDSYEARIKVMSEEDYETYLEKAEDVLNEKGYSLRDEKKESSSYDFGLLLRFKADEKIDEDALESALAEKIGIEQKLVDVSYVAATNLDGVWVDLLIILCVVLVLVLAYGFIRKSVLLAGTYTLSFLYQMLLSFALISILGIEFSLTSICIIAVFGLVSVLMVAYCINKAKQITDRKHNTKETLSDAICSIYNENKYVALIFAVVLVLLFVGLCVSGSLLLVNAGFAGLVSVLVTFITVVLFACPFYLAIVTHKDNQTKTVMSRNNLEENQKKIDKTNK